MMTRADLISLYSKKASAFSEKRAALSKEINLISNIRIVLVILIILFVYLGIKQNELFALVPVLTIVFAITVNFHSNLFNKRAHTENLLKVQQTERRVLDGNLSGLHAGREFIDPLHPYSHDLDIFGEGSLFQYINRANTIGGRKRVAGLLSAPLSSSQEIRSYQEAAEELSTLTDFRHEIQASGMEVVETSSERAELREWAAHPAFVYGSNFFRIALIVLPVLTVSSLFVGIFLDGFTKFFWLGAIVQWAILGLHLKKVNAFHQYISGKKNVLARYANILTKIEKQDFATKLMIDSRSRAHEAKGKIHELAALVGSLDARLNSMTNLVVNSIVMYDLQYVRRLEKWKVENAGKLEAWLSCVELCEALASLGTLRFNNPDFVFPKINEDRVFRGDGLAHPLIAQDERVPNDVGLDPAHAVIIITGANMAGKSTFLRTMGVNVVLALCGAPVCATEFTCPLIALRTGMRTADSLKDHQSYFYAELNRLKSIVDELKQGKTLLVLLDEILKGTNSTDKQAGSISLVTQLVNQSCLVVIATHDLALGDLERQFPERIRNFCFEPSINDDQLSFDYRLQRGVARKMNATFLMKKMGIIPKDES